MERSTIIIIDDHTILRESLADSLGKVQDLEVVGHWASTEEALSFIKSNKIDMAILDYALPGIDGIASSVKIRELQPDTKTIILSMFSDTMCILDALARGVLGYFPKEICVRDLIEAIRCILRGETVLHPKIADKLRDYFSDLVKSSGIRGGLTAEEIMILGHAGNGSSNKEIAGKTGLSIDTVKFRLKEIFCKLGAKDRAHAVCLAMRRGLIDSSSEDTDPIMHH
jgi:DNA-binding NarL/FixJ family response regulator